MDTLHLPFSPQYTQARSAWLPALPSSGQVAPCSLLADDVDAFWYRRGNAGIDGPARIDPDGCIDLIFRSRHRDGVLIEAELFVSGATTRAHSVPIGPDDSFVGVRFKPGMSRIAIDADPACLASRRGRAAEIDPRLVELERRLASTVSTGAALGALHEAVRTLAGGNRAAPAPARIRSAIAMLACGGRIDHVARRLETTTRSLHRDVLAWTGLTPKALARVLRFRAAMRTLRSDPVRGLSAVAYDTGYADQAHMTREFRAIAGVTPSMAAGCPIHSRRGEAGVASRRR